MSMCERVCDGCLWIVCRETYTIYVIEEKEYVPLNFAMKKQGLL